MFKAIKVMVLIFLVASLPILARADVSVGEITSKVKFNSGVGYDSVNHKVVNTDTVRLLGYSGFFLDPSVDVGYASNDNIVVGASIGLFNAKKVGIDIPILDLIDLRPQVLYGWGNINVRDWAGSKNTVIYGASILNVKF